MTAPETVEATEDLPPIPEGYDFGGYEFTLLNGNMADWMYTWRVTADEENGEALNDAIFKRNLAAEDALNVRIASIGQSGARATAEKPIKAGDDAYDLVLEITTDSFNMALSGSAVSNDRIESIDLENPW